MRSLSKFLEEYGYRVLNVGYPSTLFPLEALIDHVHKKVEGFNEDQQRKIHFVEYSMGDCLLVV